MENYIIDGSVVSCLAEFFVHGEDVQQINVALHCGREDLDHVLASSDGRDCALQLHTLDWLLGPDVEFGEFSIP